jgi:hypothetical protein
MPDKDYQSKRDEIRNNLLAAFAEPNDKLAYNGLDSTSQTDDVMQVVDSLVAEERQKEREKVLDELEKQLEMATSGEKGLQMAYEFIASQRNKPSEGENNNDRAS